LFPKVVFLLLCLSISPATWAQGLAEEELASAREHFKRGEAHFSLAEFEQALAEYRQAYQVRPLPPLLFNMAQCYRHLGDQRRAIFLLKRFLSAAPPEKQQEQAQSILAQLEAQAQRTPRAPGPTTMPAALEKDLKADPTPRQASQSAPQKIQGLDFKAAAVPLSSSTPARVQPFYKTWWFWTIVSGVVVGSASVAVVAAYRNEESWPGTLQAVDYR
jgi:tetratricopeptide (TPR) repeat protein